MTALEILDELAAENGWSNYGLDREGDPDLFEYHDANGDRHTISIDELERIGAKRKKPRRRR